MMIGEAASAYARLAGDREQFLNRARDCASYTIPSVMPEQESQYSQGQTLPQPWSSFGSRAVNNLTSKLTLTLFPLTTKFFRLAVDEASLEQLREVEQVELEVEEDLASIEDMVLDRIEQSGLRTKLHMAMRFVEVAGNALLHIPVNRPPRLYRLDSYVVERDPRDNLMTIVIKERVSAMVLEERLRSRLQHIGAQGEPGSQSWVEVYTILRRTRDGKGEHVWKEWQEVDGKVLHRVTTHRLDRNPYLPLRGGVIDGESYGRSHCEEYAGDLRALDALSKLLQQGSVQSGKVIWMVSTKGQARVRQLNNAPNGGFVMGNEGDVTPLQMNKHADFSVVSAHIDRLKRDLGMGFLMNSTVPRNAERVTAEEIRLVASELDDTLGGTFSLLSSDLQLPLVKIILGNMQEAGEIDELPPAVRPIIVTGLDAIGRGHDLARLDEFIGGALQTFGPEVLRFFHVNSYLTARGTALGVQGLEELVKSDEELAQEQQQEQMQLAAQQAGPELIKNMPPEALAQAAQQIAGGAPAA